VRGLRCRFFVFASGHAARVSTSNWKGASTPGNVGPGQVDTDGVAPVTCQESVDLFRFVVG
jgi:hypothetical protein